MATTKKAPVRRNVKKKTEQKIVDTKTEAQKKVEELLDGVALNKKDKQVVTDRLEIATKEKNSEWIENQMDGLTSKIEQLESENKKLKAENEVLLKKGGTQQVTSPSMGNNDFKKNIEQIFFDLEDAFTGAKFGTPYHEAKIKPLLNKFVNKFPFLIDSLKRRKTFVTKKGGK